MRPEIQALRAIAVLAVVGFHLWPGRLSGGYIGVDVFFVISGFLITGHLLREVDREDRVDLAQFWARRARRLLPAAYLVLLVTAIGVLVWLPPAQWTQNFREIIGSALYVENWVLAIDSIDYLAADGIPSAVQHYWTLSVEEQFYLVWPLLVVAALVVARRTGRARHTVVFAVLATVTLASFVYSLWLTSQHPQLAYFATPARAWQFGAGAVLALVVAADRVRLPRRTAIAASWLGFGVIAVCALAYDERTPFPGTAAIAPVLATILVIAAGAPSGRLSPTPLMAWRPVQTTGDLSYSMYLWHWPPLILLPEILDRELGFGPRVGILVGTFALAWLTVRYVENPVRFGTRGGLRRPAVTGLASLAAAAVVVAVATYGWQAGDAEEQRAEELTRRVNADMPECFGAASMPPAGECDNPELATLRVPAGPDVGRDYAGHRECWVVNDETELKSCEFGDATGVPHVVLLGDSHARAMLPAFLRLAEIGELTLTTQLKGGCAWSTDLPGRTAVPEVLQTCPAWRENVEDWIRENRDDIDLIVTTGYSRNLAGSPKERARGLSEAWKTATSLGIPVAAVVDNPDHESPPATCLNRVDRWDENTCAVRREAAFPYGDAFGDAARMTEGAERIDMTDFYCLRDVCPSMIGGVNVYRDGHHFTATFTRSLAPFLWNRITERVGTLVSDDA
ncbi:acyltransferase family protein [Aeromicrobium duanguangcaii]|uniref:acyltransferase family protein n=1 Tax=Aeromicrobium duanguangcaii TaxID=2968086 RepID=UPI0020180666|nr:acyltransferase family protein [Aeromicrobium duanguangcaii]MCL3837772.1 acyltransferase [Aeromicrobium duanguangcaii]